MPVRSLRLSTLRWPRQDEVFSALEVWVSTLEVPDLLAVGVFGSYAQGDYGVGSDLDLLIVLNSRAIPFERRMALLPLESLPVPAEALAYTLEELVCAAPAEPSPSQDPRARGGVDMGAGRLLLECPRGLARADAGSVRRDGGAVDRYCPQCLSYLGGVSASPGCFLSSNSVSL